MKTQNLIENNKKIELNSLKIFFGMIHRIFGLKIFFLIFISIISSFIEIIGISFFIPLFQKFLAQDTQTLINIKTNINYFDQFFDFLFKLSLTDLLISLIAIIIVRSIVLILIESYRVHLKFLFLTNIRKNLMKSFLNNSFDMISKKSTGYYNSLITEQSSQLTKSFDAFIRISINLLRAIFFISVSSFISFYLNIMILVFGIPFMLFVLYLSKFMKKFSINYTELAIKISSSLTQTIQSFHYLYITNQLKKFDKISFKFISRSSEYQKKMGILNQSIGYLIDPFVVLVLIIFFFIGTKFFNLEQASLFLSFTFLFRGLSLLIGFNQKILGFLTYLGPINQISQEIQSSYTKKNDENDSMVIDKNFQYLEFLNVSFKYPKMKEPVFENLSFSIARNSMIGIVGDSGSGKSTLSKLISMSVHPDNGNLFLDSFKIEKNLNTKEWRSLFGYVPQKPYLYNDTILRNITMNFDDNQISEEQFNKVNFLCDQVGLKDLINSLPYKFDEIIEDLGANFSVGQIQRLMLVRELYRNPMILILDEPTSGLDDRNKKKFLNLIESLKGKYTIIIFTHDYKSLIEADEIFQIKNRILNSINYKELINMF